MNFNNENYLPPLEMNRHPSHFELQELFGNHDYHNEYERIHQVKKDRALADMHELKTLKIENL
jgi:hypothetical protein